MLLAYRPVRDLEQRQARARLEPHREARIADDRLAFCLTSPELDQQQPAAILPGMDMDGRAVLAEHAVQRDQGVAIRLRERGETRTRFDDDIVPQA